jgi:hypothetical protein
MNSIKTTILLLTFAAVLTLSALAQTKDLVKITIANSTPAEQQTRDQLQKLLKTYDLSTWIFTKPIVIDEKTAIPHSHPVLTLNTRHVKDDELLLSTFVHEQLHWHLTQNEKGLDAAVADLKVMFPKVPDKGPEGARDEASTYLHLAVCYLEYRALRELLGELRGKQVMEFWATDHYTWIYKTVLERPRDIGNLMFKHALVPKAAK